MTDTTEREPTKLSLRPGKLELKKTVETGKVRQSFSHGRSKTVTVEVKRKRTFTPDTGGQTRTARPGEDAAAEPPVRGLSAQELQARKTPQHGRADGTGRGCPYGLTSAVE